MTGTIILTKKIVGGLFATTIKGNDNRFYSAITENKPKNKKGDNVNIAINTNLNGYCSIM